MHEHVNPVPSQERARPRRTPLAAAIAIAVMAGPPLAFAQGQAGAPDQAGARLDPAPVQPAAEAEPVTSVVVTATRRREPTRDVPMQVNTMQAEQLQKSGARSLQDYVAELPGVDVKSSGGAGLGSVTIRGVSTGNQTIATVGTYVDDVAVGSTNAYANGASSALDMSLLDLKQIELLRGPQGTLYGAGAMGGVLKYVTNEPDTNELSARASVGLDSTQGGHLSHVESAVVNVPLREDVAGLRVAAFSDRAGGWVDAVGPAAAAHANSGHTTGARVSLLVTPSRDLRIRVTDTYQNLRRDGTDLVDYDAATGRPVNGTGVRTLYGREPYKLRLNVAAVEVEYDFGWARLNAITSQQNSGYDTTIDFTAAYGPLVQASGLDAAFLPVTDVVNVKKTTQEFRLTSKGGQTVDWLAGLFWNRERASNDNRLRSVMADGTAGPQLITADLPSFFREVAAYGDLTWNISRQDSLTVGMRVARNSQSFHETGTSLLTGDIETGSSSSETSRTYLLTGKHSLTRTSNVYARIASGYRPGGPNQKVLPSDPATFAHDSLWSYELGYKADLLERTLSVEAALYKIRWSDIQQNFARNGLNVIINSGKADIKGAELSLKWRPVTDLTLTGSLALNNARLSEPAGSLGIAGARLPNSARVGATLAARYGFDLAGHAAYAGITERITGARNAGFEGSDTLPNYRMPGYAVTDLQVGVELGKVFALSGYVRNAANRHGMTAADTSLLPLGGPLMVNEERPRTIGLNLSASF